MKREEVIVHLRDNSDVSPAALLVQVSCQYRSEIHIQIGGNKTLNAKSIMGVMTFDYSDGEPVVVMAEGPDEDDAVAGVKSFLGGLPVQV
jgi:catabolite repression HPr-like protein